MSPEQPGRMMDADAPARRINTIEFVAVEAASSDLAAALAAAVSRWVAVACSVRSGVPPSPPPRLEVRDQVDADRLLVRFESEAAPADRLRVGLTAHDLGSALFAHMFGQARVGGHVALVSVARLCPTFYGLTANPDAVVRRARLETLHEIGHLVGLRHCRDFACLMHRADTVEDIDVRGVGFCSSCRSAFPAGLLV